MQTEETTISTTEINQQEQLAWKLRIKGWSQDRIADHLGLSPEAVSRMLKNVRARLAREYAEDRAGMIAELTDRLYHIVSEALDAWEQSKQASPPKKSTEENVSTQVDTWREAPPCVASGACACLAESEGLQSIANPIANPIAKNIAEPITEPIAQPNAASLAATTASQGKPAYLRIALQALKALQALWKQSTPEEIEPDPASYATNLVGIDMERFRLGLGDPDDDPQIQTA